MLFNSFRFAVFFPIVVFLFFLIKPRHRWVLLLIASYIFYASWQVEYLILIIVSTLIDYFCALRISHTDNPTNRKAFLYLSVVVNLGILAVFKYLFFFAESTWWVLDNINDYFHYVSNIPNPPLYLKFLLPVGISFYTFQTLSYTIDVYRGVATPERHLGKFALFVSFFPQLVAGPIERYNHLMPQLKSETSFDYQKITEGLKIMAIGFFKKLVIADRAAILVDQVYANPDMYFGLEIFVVVILFYFQIYGDFSGYTDIARGAARIMGYNLSQNFNQPYLASNFNNFWQRWHITLTKWFRDYLYFWLRRSLSLKIPTAIIITFAMVGLWHGANWTFLFWGALNGVAMAVEQWVERSKAGVRLPFISKGSSYKINRFLGIAITFLLISLTGVFFRANNIKEAGTIFRNLFSFQEGISLFGSNDPHLYILVFLTAFLFIVKYLSGFKRVEDILIKDISAKPFFIRWSVYIIIVYLILNLGIFTKHAFVYFQF